MGIELKRLDAQVVVITGGTSGIGLATARLVATRGARVVLAARNEAALRQVVAELVGRGARAVYAAADVADEAQVQAVARRALEAFGGFDTWVNLAGISIYGPMIDVPLSDHRRLFETNFWGVVNGSFVAAEHLRERGGALINVGSVLSDFAVPLQGMYSASKHAVKGFTDAFRLEVEREGWPISVTLIKPSSIDTPYREHAKNEMDVEPNLVPLAYEPDAVARAIVHCAQQPVREVVVGGSGRAAGALVRLAPRLADRVMERAVFGLQRTDRPAERPERNALDQPGHDLRVRGGAPRRVLRRSLYTASSLHPVATAATLVGVGLATLGALVARRVRRGPKRRKQPESKERPGGSSPK